MSDYFAAMPASNSSVLCVGSITRSEAACAKLDGFDIDTHGYYLFLARHDDPAEPIHILARFFTPLEAERAARIFQAKAI
jgi:hypothetical protein